MLVEDWPLVRIKPYPGNPRKRSKHAVRKVADSIREFGPRQPIVVDEDGIILVGRTNEETEWDIGPLSIELKALEGFKFDLTFTGFDLRQVNGYTRGGPRPVLKPARLSTALRNLALPLL